MPRYFLSALAVAALSGGGYYTYHHGRMPDWYWEARLPDNIEVLDVSDTNKLKHVLFSGEPWLLQCYSGLPYDGQWLPRPYRVHRIFEESLGSLRGLVKAGVLDCEKRLPSNKSLVEKFGFVRRSQPLLVLAAGGVKPRQLPANSVDSAYSVTAFVKPKAEPKVHKVATQKTLEAVCGGRRACLLTRMAPDSVVLEQLARTFRTVEVVTLGEDQNKIKLSWGRGEEVGETLEEDEAQHFGQRISFLKYDAEAPRARKGARPPRLLRGFGGEEDLPSLSRFVTSSLEATDGFMATPLPTVSAPAREKKKTTKNDNAEVQARRAKQRAAARAKEEAQREAKQAAWDAQQAAKKLSPEQLEEQRRQREAQRRAAMEAESEAANDIVESVEEGEEDEEYDTPEDEEDYSDDTLDLDA